MASRRPTKKIARKKPVHRKHERVKVHAKRHAARHQVSRKIIKRVKRVPHRKVAKPIKVRKETAREIRKKLEAKESLEASMKAIDRTREIISDGVFKEHLSKNVGGGAGAIVNALLEGPLADEKLSEALGIKPNETRRVLNVLNSYGIVRYNINKDSNGWLTFIWYIDHDSVITVRDQLQKSIEAKRALPEDCNDFFACPSCSAKHAAVLPFTDAFEALFKCSCGKSLKRVSKEEAENIYNSPVS